jgi:hypothetical protein
MGADGQDDRRAKQRHRRKLQGFWKPRHLHLNISIVRARRADSASMPKSR